MDPQTRTVDDLLADPRRSTKLTLAKIGGWRLPSTRALRRALLEHREAKGWNRVTAAREAGVTHDFVKVAETRPQKSLERTELEKLMHAVGLKEIPAEPDLLPPRVWEPGRDRASVGCAPELRALLKERRVAARKSRNEVAELCGFSTTHLRDMETSARCRYSLECLARLGNALEVHPNDALGKRLLRKGLLWRGEHVAWIDKTTGKKVAFDWDNVPLGQESDVALAERLGTDTERVWAARRKRGIPAYRGPLRNRGNISKTRQRLADAVIELLGVPPVNHEGVVDWAVVPFGHVPAPILGRWLGVSAYSVRSRARRYGISSPTISSLVDWSQLPLGRIPDTHIAAMTGLSVSAVAKQRRALDIPPSSALGRAGRLPLPLLATQFVLRPPPVDHGPLPPPDVGASRNATDLRDRL